MSFEKEFQIPHESGDFWSSMTSGMPIPDKKRIGHGEGSQATMRSGIEFAGVGDRIPGRSMMMDNGSGCNVGSWNTATKSTSFQRNGTGQSDDFWVPVTSKKLCDTNTTSTTLQRNGIGQSDDFWVPVTSEKRCNITTKSTTLQRNGTGQSDNFWIPVTSEKHRNTTTKSTTLQRNGTGQSDNFWIPVTSEKHINERANPVPGEMQKNRLETENWQDLLGMYTDLLQEKTVDTNGILEDINRQPPPVVHNNGYPPPVVHNNGYPNWVASNRNLNHVAHQNHTANQATSYNTPVTSMLRSQQSQRFASNNLISNAHNAQDGFPVNYNPHYSPSSPPRFKPDAAASSVTDSFTFAPITPDNQRKYMDGQRLEEKVNFSGEETSTRAENLYNELLQTIENSPPSAVSSTQKDDIVSEDKDEQDNDLEKTPNQKTPTRRKKHRPKVIREGKLKRTPKDPKNSTSGEIRVKRKYVRRKGVNNSNENTPVETVQKRKYVRKKGVNSSNENSPAETVQKRKYVRKKGVDHSECQQQNTTVDTPPKSCKKQLIFDSESVTQDEGHESKSSLQDINVLNTPPVKTRYHDLNVLARNMATSPIQDRWENGYVNKVNELVQGNENKNVIIQANMRPMNMQCINRSFTSECMMNFDEKRGIKRQSIEEMSHNENAMNSLLWYQKMLLGAANRAYNCNQLNSTFLENHKKMKMQTEFQDNSRQMKGMIVNRSSTELLNSCTVRIDPVYKNVRIDPAYKNIMNVGGYGGNHHFRRPMAATHYLLKRQLLNGMHPHMMRLIQERSQRYTQGAMIGWNPNRASRFAVTTYPKVEPNLYNRRLNGLNEKLQQLRNNSLKSYHQSLSKARGRPRKQKAEDPVDIITHKLERLYISDSNKKHQNELVLYRGGDAIVPFEPIKKRNRNQRPKVDLDPESERLWNLLMGIDESNGAEKKDDDKEKWWENERRVFRGRTDSFIARMHLVQGDRRFSRWKGSVVDSVIGVFLTQNVSDHLSSSAFMSLAAKFPPKSTTANKTCCQDDIINSPPNSSENVTRHSSPTRGAENKHSAISEEEVILSQDSVDSSTIQTVNEYGSSSGSNSEADDLRTGIETSKQSATPQKEKPTMLKEHSCNDNLATNMNHPQKNPACNIQISRMNGTDLNSSSSQFQMSKTPSLLSSNSVVTEACHTTNVTNPQYEKPKFQTPSQGHPSQILNTNQHATEFFNETRHGAPKKVSTMFGGIPVISVEDSISVVNKQASFEDTVSEANSREQNASCAPISGPGSINMPRTKKETPEDERNRTIDWDSLRKEALSKSEKKERSEDARDTIDYEALRRANVNEISDVIKERGMNNLLADRMKDFLNRLVRDHGTVDLEWLRDAPPDKAKDYLLSFRGLGLKSVECVRLLTLHHLAFPVDTNVGRIAVRLGWVPLQPLPESLQLHLLEMYPVLESIQKYLWPRLCKLDQLTLYELHYQMITFGKVFCTKSKPNCNACPMRAECRHFASAFASARLSLPGPEEKSIVTSDAPVTAEPIPPVVISPMPLPPTENETNQSTGMSGNTCQPIIEEPTTPEPEANELSISDIEDQYYEDSDDIPTIKLNMEEFTTNLQNIMQDSNDMSKALVALNPKAASIPTPKLKDVSRLRTEHLVYELPDSHQLLEGLDKREPDDPSPYLLAIWTPGETANSVQAPTIDCSAQQSGQLCDRTTCFSCNNVREASSQVVRGTILIPCRTAMRGSFPLNGTYFQVNEMFADHASSLNPIDVPRSWIWNLPRRKVYFGTSVSTIFKGLTTEGIQYCFWKGFVCVRGFDRINRTPRPLMARLHFPASKLITQKTKANK